MMTSVTSHSEIVVVIAAPLGPYNGISQRLPARLRIIPQAKTKFKCRNLPAAVSRLLKICMKQYAVKEKIRMLSKLPDSSG